MKWESINLHLENLFPGLVSFFLLIKILPSWFVNPFYQGCSSRNEFLETGIFLAASYLLGAVAVAASRLVVDRPSECVPRPLLIKLLSRGSLKGKPCKKVNEDYREKLKQVMASGNDIVKQEVLRRRERGRLVRTALVPSILSVWFVASSCSSFTILFWIPVIYVFITVIYAYVEATIYEECLLA